MSSINIYIISAKEDYNFFEEFMLHIEPLKRSRRIKIESLHDILPGSDILATSKEGIECSDIVLVFVSVKLSRTENNFVFELINHAYSCYNLNRINKRIYQVTLRPSFLLKQEDPVLKNISSFPSQKVPIDNPSWHNQDYAWDTITRDFRDVIDDLIYQRTVKQTKKTFSEQIPYAIKNDVFSLNIWLKNMFKKNLS
jgi:hypothetical protein